MKVIEVQRKELNPKEWVKRTALESDYDTLITEPCMIVENGEVKIIYDHFEEDTMPVVHALQKIKFSTGRRSRGLLSTSRVFGYKPRNEMRQDFCSVTSLAEESPNEHRVVADLAIRLEQHYKKYNPEGWEKHRTLADKEIKESWKMGGSIFTSGIINKNNPLKYHYDTGNFKQVYSLMIVFKGGVEGGYLSVPEYGLAFALPHNSLFMFDGQGLLHGVTPIKYSSPQGYRFSMVYYTLKRMWQCLEANEELVRIRQRKTVRERSRLETPLNEEDRIYKEKKETQLRNRMGKQ